MPTYEYTCTKCGREFDFFQSMKDTALTVCPKDRCQEKQWGRGKVKRLIGGGAGLIFKGGGFYITDYRSEGYKASAKKEAEAAKPSSTDAKSSAAASPAAPAKTSTPAKTSAPAKPASPP